MSGLQAHSQPSSARDSKSGDLAVIEIDVQSLRRLFNSMDPSPFREKDLDRDAEEFIISWASEFPHEKPIHLRIHLGPEDDTVGDPEAIARDAIGNYFVYRAAMKQRELRQLLRQGRASLFIGLAFLAFCIVAGRIISAISDSAWLLVVQESLLIGGWVAMWRPLEIFLYAWWPIRQRRQLLDRLANASVEVVRKP